MEKISQVVKTNLETSKNSLENIFLAQKLFFALNYDKDSNDKIWYEISQNILKSNIWKYFLDLFWESASEIIKKGYKVFSSYEWIYHQPNNNDFVWRYITILNQIINFSKKHAVQLSPELIYCMIYTHNVANEARFGQWQNHEVYRKEFFSIIWEKKLEFYKNKLFFLIN